MSFKRIGIYGLGLMGGSLAKAIKAKCRESQIVAYDIHHETLDCALSEGIIDSICQEDLQGFSTCDLIFLCAPVQKNIDVLDRLHRITSDDCILSDIGSTKKAIIGKAEEIGCNRFIGGHPMTGSEKSGITASSSHLYENAYYILTPREGMASWPIQKLSSLITVIGALPVIVAPQEHDFITATISHVPHLIASCLVNMVKRLDNSANQMHTLAAGGFKDITRIASSSPDMWQQICLTNKENIKKVIHAFQEELASIDHCISDETKDQVWQFFADSRDYRNSFSDKRTGSIIKTYKVTVDVVDEPGIIARIATLLSEHDINIKNIGINNNREHQEGVLEIMFYDASSRDLSVSILKDMGIKVYDS